MLSDKLKWEPHHTAPAGECPSEINKKPPRRPQDAVAGPPSLYTLAFKPESL
jgi:hypothetical protein